MVVLPLLRINVNNNNLSKFIYYILNLSFNIILHFIGGVQYIDGFIQPVQYEADYLFYEGTLPGSGTPTDQPANPSESASSTSTSKTNDGYSSKPIGPGKLSWVAIVGFISVGVISF